MATPTATKTWVLLPNQTITYVSLLATLGAYVTINTNQMIACGMTCVGSSNGVTAAMDGVNRCTTAAGFAVRATIAGAAQSWIVVSDGVIQIKFTYKGATDDVATIAFSPGSLYVVAGTATFEPTATDERLIITGTSIIGSATSGNRVAHVWVDSTHRLWRSAIMAAGILCAPLLFCELFDSSPVTGGVVTIPVPVWGGVLAANQTQFVNTGLGSAYSANTSGGLGRVILSGTPTNVSYGGTYEIFNVNGSDSYGVNAQPQGNVPLLKPLGIAFSNVGGIFGKAGNRYDWYAALDYQANGSLTSTKNWVQLNNVATNTTGGVWWPWDVAVASCVTA